MLQQLIIKNFTIIESLQLNFTQGLYVITGETGAGKSIILDALKLVMGYPVKGQLLGSWGATGEIIAIFADYKLRCVIQTNKVKNFFNHKQISSKQLRSITEKIKICDQHSHLHLLQSSYQMSLLDTFLQQPDLLLAVQAAFNEVTMLRSKYTQLQQQPLEAELAYLEYQITELQPIVHLAPDFQHLQQQYQTAMQQEKVLTVLQQLDQVLFTDIDGVSAGLQKCQQILRKNSQYGALLGIEEHLTAAQTILMEVSAALEQASAPIDLEALEIVGGQLSTMQHLARKHKITPDALSDYYQSLLEQQQALMTRTECLHQLEQQIATAEQQYMCLAKQLSSARLEQAQHLCRQITEYLAELALHEARLTFKIQSDVKYMSAHGIDAIELQFSAHAQQVEQNIKYSASGGELARLHLAFELALAKLTATEVLIFDEIDVGISGRVASLVGAMLLRISQNKQLFCITHLPQVASYGTHHLRITKQHDRHTLPVVSVTELVGEARITEIAQLLAGEKITEHALAQALELLKV
jgi:DNA repair protein RecN (Recombination protein N)